MATMGAGNHFEGGEFGTGGKFRKRPFRRAQATPYDRPLTALRSPKRNSRWFSKFVDPAQRLLTSSAHMLFSSVFRKRLPPTPATPLQSLSSDPEQGGRDNHQEAVGFVTEDSVDKQQGASGESDIQTNAFERDGFSELEKLLKQKTFTRSEINHLTALLNSKVMDSAVGEENRTEVVPSEPVLSYKLKEPPALENGIKDSLVSTPLVSSSVLDEDIASPAELAKAYMGSRPSKVSPLCSQSLALREDPTLLDSQPFPPKSPTMSIALRPTSQLRVLENGLVTPRSRGRCAIYSMAHTPYARVHPSSSVKGVGLTVEAGLLSSSAQLDHGRISAPKFGVGKRRISVLDNDIGSVGPIRGVRHKSNALSSRRLSNPGSSSPVSITRSICADDTQQPSCSMQKPLVLGEARNTILKLSTENGDGTLPSTSSRPIPSKSSEMASKILQQLDKMVSPKEKSPELKLAAMNDKSPRKLSPSVLHGQALGSIETVDSSKFLQYVPDKILDGPLKKLFADAQNLPSMDDYKVENGSLQSVAPSGVLAPVVTDADATIQNGQIISGANFGDNSITKPVSPPSQRRAFHMSVQEGDDSDVKGTVSSLSTAGKEKTDFTAVAGTTTSATETILMERAPQSSATETILLDNEAFFERADASVVDEKIFTSTSITLSSSLTSKPVSVAAATQLDLTSDKCALANGSIVASPLFAFGEHKAALLTESSAAMPLVRSLENVDSSKESVANASLINSGNNKNVDTVPQMSSLSSVDDESFGYQFSASSESELGSSISATISADANDWVLKVPHADAKANQDIGFSVISSEPTVSSAASTSLSTSTTSIFTFGHKSNQNNGSSTSSPPFCLPVQSVSGNFTGSSSSSGSSLASSSSNNATFAPTSTSMLTSTLDVAASTYNSSSTPVEPSASSTSFFKFRSTAVTSTDLPISSTFGSEPAETKSRQDAGFGNFNSPAFGSSSASYGIVGSGIFGFSSSMTTVNQSLSSSFGSSIGLGLGTQASTTTGFATTESQSIQFDVQTSAAATVFGNSTHSPSIEFGSSASSPFGSSMNATFSSGSALFASSSPKTIFRSGRTVGFSTFAPSSVANSVSSNAGTTSSFLGLSSWQPSKSSFASTLNSSSPGFSFGASTSSSVSSSSSLMAVSFTSVAATSVQPVFSNPNPVVAFNSAPTSNNDQMGMEDSMAEDTGQATPPAPVFGQPPTPPQSNFVFGVTVPSGASPFQFGNQQNIATQNPSPFQASGSLEINGGSFSLGTGGGDKSNRKYIRVKHKQRKN